MKKILVILCICMVCFCDIVFAAKQIKQNTEDITCNVNPETEYWAVIVCTNTTNITSIYNSIIDKPNWNKSHIILLKGEQATKENILDALDWLSINADSQDIVLFSFTGHGTYTGIFINRKYGIAPWDNNPILTDELDEKLDQIKCKYQCLFFDCCLSGNFVGRKFLFFSSILDEENRVILMSTRRRGGGFTASVFEGDEEVNVINFPRFVSEAFQKGIDKNSDGWVSAEEAFRYGRKKFRPYAIIFFLFIPLQIQAFIESRGFFLIPFPKIYDGVEGDLPLVKI